jgi:hypothetical protein
MFAAIRRAKATSAVKTVLHSFFAPLTVFGNTVPNTIYEDPFVLGYFSVLIEVGFLASNTVDLSVEDKDFVRWDVLQQLAGDYNAKSAIRNIETCIKLHDPELIRGTQEAGLLVRVMYGMIGLDDPEIADLSSQCGNDKTKVLAVLGTRFVNYVDQHHRRREGSAS